MQQNGTHKPVQTLSVGANVLLTDYKVEGYVFSATPHIDPIVPGSDTAISKVTIVVHVTGKSECCCSWLDGEHIPHKGCPVHDSQQPC